MPRPRPLTITTTIAVAIMGLYHATGYRSGYSPVTGCVLTQAIRPALQNLRVFLLRKSKEKNK